METSFWWSRLAWINKVDRSLSLKNFCLRFLDVTSWGNQCRLFSQAILRVHHALCEFLGRTPFMDPICCNFCMVLSMFLRLVLANSLFSLRDINLTLGLLPPRRHVVWRDSVGVESSRLRFTSECKDIFRQSFLWLLRHTDEPQKARNSCLWLHPSLFWVLLVSCWCLAKLIFP